MQAARRLSGLIKVIVEISSHLIFQAHGGGQRCPRGNLGQGSTAEPRALSAAQTGLIAGLRFQSGPEWGAVFQEGGGGGTGPKWSASLQQAWGDLSPYTTMSPPPAGDIGDPMHTPPTHSAVPPGPAPASPPREGPVPPASTLGSQEGALRMGHSAGGRCAPGSGHCCEGGDRTTREADNQPSRSVLGDGGAVTNGGPWQVSPDTRPGTGVPGRPGPL